MTLDAVNAHRAHLSLLLQMIVRGANHRIQIPPALSSWVTLGPAESGFTVLRNVSSSFRLLAGKRASRSRMQVAPQEQLFVSTSQTLSGRDFRPLPTFLLFSIHLRR